MSGEQIAAVNRIAIKIGRFKMNSRSLFGKFFRYGEFHASRQLNALLNLICILGEGDEFLIVSVLISFEGSWLLFLYRVRRYGKDSFHAAHR